MCVSACTCACWDGFVSGCDQLYIVCVFQPVRVPAGMGAPDGSVQGYQCLLCGELAGHSAQLGSYNSNHCT